MEIEIVGIYAVEAAEPCHLVEMRVRAHVGAIDLAAFTQERLGLARCDWQAPWDERVLNEEGTADLVGRFPRLVESRGEPLRIAFFFHYLDVERPLVTPAGDVILPTLEVRPARLGFMEYECPN